MKEPAAGFCGAVPCLSWAGWRRVGFFIVVFVGGLASLAPAEPGAFELNLKGFSVPDLSQAEYLGYIRWDYTDRVAGAESLVRLYRTEGGAEFRSVSTNGRIWLYYIQDGEAPLVSFYLADENGDGVFETKFLRGETVPVPYWVLSLSGADEREAGR